MTLQDCVRIGTKQFGDKVIVENMFSIVKINNYISL